MLDEHDQIGPGKTRRWAVPEPQSSPDEVRFECLPVVPYEGEEASDFPTSTWLTFCHWSYSGFRLIL